MKTQITKELTELNLLVSCQLLKLASHDNAWLKEQISLIDQLDISDYVKDICIKTLKEQLKGKSK